MEIRRRGLEDVLHYFIPEEEQAEARQRARPALDPEEEAPEASPRTGARWCLPARPGRPLDCALAFELGAALGCEEDPACILASFPAGRLAPRSRRAHWRRVEPHDPEALARALDALPDPASALVVVPPEELRDALAALPEGALDGLVLAIDASPRGLTRALALLREAAPRPSLTIGVVIVGAPDEASSGPLFERLQRAARRQQRLEVERFGQLPRDPAGARSLLAGISVLELEAETASARSLRALGERLAPR